MRQSPENPWEPAGSPAAIGAGREAWSTTQGIAKGHCGSGLRSLVSTGHVWGSGSAPLAASVGKVPGKAGGRPEISYTATAGKARRG